MSEHLLSVKKREGIGRGHSRRLRAQGMIPAVIYGKSGNRNFAVVERDFQILLREVAGSTAVITLTQDDQRFEALIHETQRDPLTDRFRHIDFLEVVAGEMINAHIPVHTVGEPVGVKTGGGLLDVVVHELQVHCLPRNLPEFIEIDVSALNIGDAIHIEDLPVLEGVTFDHEPDMVIVAVAAPAKLEAAPVVAEAPVAEVPATKVKAKPE